MSRYLPTKFRRALARRRAERASGHIDAVAGSRISGWAFGKDGIEVGAVINGRVVASAIPDRPRPDVARSFPGVRRASHSGFALTIPEIHLPTDMISKVAIKLRVPGKNEWLTQVGTLSMAGRELLDRATRAVHPVALGALPQGVVQELQSVWPSLRSGADDQELLSRLEELLSEQQLRSLPQISAYARYLRTVWAHCQFVDRYFPTINPIVQSDRNDFHCKPNSIQELFSVVNQLYVNQSYGIPGDFAEFGCFKGFSSSILSFACKCLGVKMHIYDSFQGLPLAEGSGYLAGEYSGSIEEVMENVSRFGAVDVVEFHQGFFSNTFATEKPPSLALLWMDVDLECSARDMSAAIEQLDQRSAFFSHECSPEIFQDGEIITYPNPDNPIFPMVQRFEELGRPLTGRFIYGNTGAFWPKNGGVAVLSNDHLMRLLRMC